MDHISFLFHMIKSKQKLNVITSQCRGLVLASHDGRIIKSPDEIVGETIILAFPMTRFFNYGDPNAAQIDFDDPETAFLEKLNGTLCIVYHDPFKTNDWNGWCVATRNVPEANLSIDGFDNLTFRKLFELALFDTKVSLGQKGFNQTNVWGIFQVSLDKGNTYCYELTSPENRIVVDYKERRIHLLSYRSNETGNQYDGRNFSSKIHPPDDGVPIVEKHTIRNITELLEFVNNQNPLEHEGVVVVQ